jgi:ABC-2 type transport system permease protein
MNLRIVWALTCRYLFLYARNWLRAAEVVFWPTMELVTWGFVTVYIEKEQGGVGNNPFAWLLGGVILWDVMFRSQQGVSVSFLEDVWTRNLLNIFVAPVRPVEYIAATFTVGFIRILVTVLLLATLSWLFYSFNLLSLGVSLIPFFGLLLVFGWSIGVVATAMIMRYGQAAENLAWAIPFLVQPITAVYYPVSVMPPWLQSLALSLPSTHVFEGMRGVMSGAGFSWAHFGWAVLLNVIFMAGAAWFYARTLRKVKELGLLAKVATT